MNARALIEFYRKRWRARRLQELFAVLGIAVGVALLFAVQVASTSLSASIEQLTSGLVGRAQWQLVARDPNGLDDRILTTIRASPDVKTAAALLEMPAALRSRGRVRSATLVAADSHIGELDGALPSGYGHVLGALRSVVISDALSSALHVRPGQRVTLALRGRAIPVTVGPSLTSKDFGALAQTPIAVVALTYGRALAGLPARVSRVYVLARKGREGAVRRLLQRVAAGHADVRSADFDAQVFEQAALPNDESTGLFAFISAFVGFLFAFNALLLLVGQRRELIRLLALWGIRRRDRVRILLLDALVLGTVASLLGLGLGILLSRSVFPPAPGYLALAFPVGAGRIVHWYVAGLAFGSGVAAAMLATIVPLWPQLSRYRTGERRLRSLWRVVLQRDARWALVASVVSFGLATAVKFAAPGAAVVGVLALIASMVLCLPMLLSALLAFGHRLQYRSNTSLLLAIEALRANRTRSVAIAALAAIALLGSVAIEGSHRDLQRGLDQDVHQLSSVSDLWVSAAGPANALATTSFRLDAVDQIKRLSDVAAVHIQRGGFLDLGNRRTWVLAPPRDAAQPIPINQIINGNPRQAIKRLRGHGWAAVSQALADDQHLRIGQTFTLQAPKPKRFRLAAIISNLGWTPGTTVINAEDYERAWQSTDASALRVDLAPGISPTTGKHHVEQALGAHSGLIVETAAEREHRQRETARQGLARLTYIAALVLGAAALAMAAATGAMIWQRRPALAGAKLIGISTREIRQSLWIESALLLFLGCTLGALYGLYGVQLLNRTLTTVTGFPVATSLALPVAALSYATLALLAFTIAASASHLAAKVPARTAFQD